MHNKKSNVTTLPLPVKFSNRLNCLEYQSKIKGKETSNIVHNIVRYKDNLSYNSSSACSKMLPHKKKKEKKKVNK